LVLEVVQVCTLIKEEVLVLLHVLIHEVGWVLVPERGRLVWQQLAAAVGVLRYLIRVDVSRVRVLLIHHVSIFIHVDCLILRVGIFLLFFFFLIPFLLGGRRPNLDCSLEVIIKLQQLGASLRTISLLTNFVVLVHLSFLLRICGPKVLSLESLLRQDKLIQPQFILRLLIVWEERVWSVSKLGIEVLEVTLEKLVVLAARVVKVRLLVAPVRHLRLVHEEHLIHAHAYPHSSVSLHSFPLKERTREALVLFHRWDAHRRDLWVGRVSTEANALVVGLRSHLQVVRTPESLLQHPIRSIEVLRLHLLLKGKVRELIGVLLLEVELVDRKGTLWILSGKHVWDIHIASNDVLELVPYQRIVRLIRILQPVQVVEDNLNFIDAFGFMPELLMGVAKALDLDVFDFIHGVFLLFSPLELLIEEV